jgi:hypothetical protein
VLEGSQSAMGAQWLLGLDAQMEYDDQIQMEGVDDMREPFQDLFALELLEHIGISLDMVD